MAALVAAAGCIEFPRDIDGDVSSIAIHVIPITKIQAIIGCTFCSVSTEDVIC